MDLAGVLQIKGVRKDRRKDSQKDPHVSCVPMRRSGVDVRTDCNDLVHVSHSYLAGRGRGFEEALARIHGKDDSSHAGGHSPDTPRGNPHCLNRPRVVCVVHADDVPYLLCDPVAQSTFASVTCAACETSNAPDIYRVYDGKIFVL